MRGRPELFDCALLRTSSVSSSTEGRSKEHAASEPTRTALVTGESGPCSTDLAMGSQAMLAGFRPNPSSCCLLSAISNPSAGPISASAIFPARACAIRSLRWTVVVWPRSQHVVWESDSRGGLTPRYRSTNVSHCLWALISAALPPSVFAFVRRASIKPHCIKRHCRAKSNASESARLLWRYGSAIAIARARIAPRACTQPDHSALVIQAGHQSLHSRQYSCAGCAAGTALAIAVNNGFASINMLHSFFRNPQ